MLSIGQIGNQVKVDELNKICYVKIITIMLNTIQFILSIPLIAAILLQARGTSLSGIFGGEGNVYRTRRGIEKSIFIFTIINAVLFFGIALLNVLSKA